MDKIDPSKASGVLWSERVGELRVNDVQPDPLVLQGTGGQPLVSITSAHKFVTEAVKVDLRTGEVTIKDGYTLSDGAISFWAAVRLLASLGGAK